jgi:hypothetical protein
VHNRPTVSLYLIGGLHILEDFSSSYCHICHITHQVSSFICAFPEVSLLPYKHCPQGFQNSLGCSQRVVNTLKVLLKWPPRAFRCISQHVSAYICAFPVHFSQRSVCVFMIKQRGTKKINHQRFFFLGCTIQLCHF